MGGEGAGMAKIWIPDFLEFKRLKKDLGIPTPHALGILETLNIYCHKNTQDLHGVRFKPGDIPELCEWQSKIDLEAALLHHGWIIKRDGTYLLEDYDAPTFVRKRLARQNASRNKCPDNDRSMTGQCPDNDRSMTGQCPDNVRLEEPKEAKRKKADPTRPTDREHPPASFSDVGGATHNRKEQEPEKKKGTAFKGDKGAVRAGDKAAGFLETVAIPKRGQDGHRERYLDFIMKTMGDGEPRREWWGEVYDKMKATTDGLETLKTVVLEASTSPPFGPENPGAYIAARCKEHLKKHGQRLPKKPAA